ncbi:hypothetical protein AB205_0202660 [Aquarana catesbeiana]|uniref:Uncharacterized protein n=1 Tax=Aquarana catesbeiana TaxID=8400 RepID=A0A2G9QA15_AQUCT|nr:hypothetical protein AB205_0208620 [Aquarana catesbeiana]PIO12580.1 hypothetical protein AB205_0202660 [Aquarana catesbeiana]
MSFVEMVEMVDILKRANYDGKHGLYPNPNVRKAKIMAKVVKSLQKNFGVRRSKDQLRKLWSDLKLRKQDQYRRIKRVLQKREKRLGTSEDTRDPQPHKEGEVTTPQPQDVEEGEVYEVGKIVTTTGDVDVVEEESHFTSASAQILIGEIIVCNRDLQKIKEDINDVEKRLKNIIDYFESQILNMHTVCQHVLSAITGYQCTSFVGTTPSSQLK